MSAAHTQVIHSVGLFTARLVPASFGISDVTVVTTDDGRFVVTIINSPDSIRNIVNTYTNEQQAAVRFLWSNSTGNRLVITNAPVTDAMSVISSPNTFYTFDVQVGNNSLIYMMDSNPFDFSTNTFFSNSRLMVYEDWRYRGIATVTRSQKDSYVKFKDDSNSLCATRLTMREISLKGKLLNYDRENLEDIAGYERYNISRNQYLNDIKESDTYMVALIANPMGSSDEMVSHYFPSCKISHSGGMELNPRIKRREIDFSVDVLKTKNTAIHAVPFEGFELLLRTPNV